MAGDPGISTTNAESPVTAAKAGRDADQPRLSRGETAFVVLALAFFAVLSIGSIRKESVTTNEVIYLAAGLSYWQRFDYRMDIEHPPLIKLIATFPELLLHAKNDYTDPTWTKGPRGTNNEYAFGRKFFEFWNANHRTLLFVARLSMIAVALVLGLSVWVFARRLAGLWGGALAVTLFATSPFFLANGPLVMTDVGVALFGLWTMWFFAALWQQPTSRNALLFAGSLAAALLAKYSAVFLFPSIFVAWVWFRLSKPHSTGPEDARPSHLKPFYREQLAIGAMLLASVVVFVFFFAALHNSDPLAILRDQTGEIESMGAHVILMYRCINLMTRFPALQHLLLPVWLYAGGLAFVVGHGSRPVYLLGHWHPTGVWYYFPVVSFFKLAPGIIGIFVLLAALAVVVLGKKRSGSRVLSDSNRLYVYALLSALIVFGGIAVSSHLNVGIRHFSVPLTLTLLLSSLVIPLARSIDNPRVQQTVLAITGLLAFSCVITAVLTYPHYLAYYNVFRLNMPKQEISIGSNLSLGQSMDELDAFFQEHHVAQPYVDRRTTPVDPAVYVPGARTWTCDEPAPAIPEWVAVSTVMMLRQPPNCRDLLRYRHWDVGDGAVIVFHTTELQGSP